MCPKTSDTFIFAIILAVIDSFNDSFIVTITTPKCTRYHFTLNTSRHIIWKTNTRNIIIIIIIIIIGFYRIKYNIKIHKHDKTWQ